VVATLIRFRDVGYAMAILALLTIVGWQKAALEGKDFAFLKASFLQNRKTEALSNDLVIQQTIALGANEKKQVSYVDRIRTVQVPQECLADERNYLGSRGVHDVVRPGGAPAVGRPAAAVPGPEPDARP